VLAVVVAASARLPPTLARQAAGRFGHGGQAILSDRPTAYLARSVRSPVAELRGMPRLLLAGGSYSTDRLVGFLGAHPLRGVGVPEAPAHFYIVSFAEAMAALSRLAQRGAGTAGD